MKAIQKIGMWKAIAFLTIVISLFSCISCDPDLNIKSQVTISSAENVITSSATVVAYVVPNGDATVSFQYQANNSAWVTKSLPTKFSGSDKVKVTLDLYDLQPSTLYNFTVTAVNAAGSVTSSVSSFTTGGLTLAVIKIKSAENVKISTASLKASVIPNQDNTSIAFEYQTANSTWKTQALGTTFSGTDSTKVNLDLSDLQANTLYNFRVRVSNKAGEVVSDIVSFTTYAVSDYDGNLYHTIVIGIQTWLKENFKGIHYVNGDPIPNVTDTATWKALKSGAYCYYNNDPNNGKIFGGLYNWYARVDSRGLISGWRTPTNDDFRQLNAFLYEGNDLSSAGRKMVDFNGNYWKFPQSNANNSSGFSALPNGYLGDDSYSNNFNFFGLNMTATFGGADLFGEFVNQASIGGNYNFIYQSYGFKNIGLGLRLIKN
jgi:uncharacterized protein (TIGR02145 family)